MEIYLLLMHSDAAGEEADWEPYVSRLREWGVLRGGSAIGTGTAVRKSGTPSAVSDWLTGYIIIEAASLDEAQSFVAGNPVFEAGGTVEVRLLPRTD